ncbi:MAG: hypothetical protein Q8K65_10820 [Alphaproteobacteria bacterium]|nr:hypothetical protein [Alphaproteobacteria bacterium]
MPQTAILQKQAPLSAPAEADDAMAALAAFVNARSVPQTAFSFKALPPDMSLQDAPTYVTELRNAAGELAATYKFNYFFDGDASSWQFFPLVIQWAENAKYRSEGMDRAIIEHCVSSLRAFFVQDVRLTIASGYLTTQRHGRAFFERMGWQLHSYDKQGGQYPLLALQPAPMQFIARRIDDISMPFRTDEAEAGTLCFAVLDL